MSWSEVKKINSDLTTPLDLLIQNMSFIKSIQRGTTKSSDQYDVTIYINDINVDKTIVLVDSLFTYYCHENGTVQQAYLKNLSSVAAVFAPHFTPTSTTSMTLVQQNFYWQIIEFY